ncbi:ABC transporter permease [Agaribacterium sp. ZY112]|uniref:ABC transporter permease n=1 Tax=Agaribacterium sp. ZY112 TaxID=3233574 RepID=UPI003526AD93
MSLSLLLAWRNLWRHKRRTWLTLAAMMFSNVLLIFMISLQLSTYDLMISNSLRAFSGQLQLNKEGYQDEQKMRQSINNAQSLLASMEPEFKDFVFAPRASAFVLAGSETRSYGIAVTGVDVEKEKQVSNIAQSIVQGSYLSAAANIAQHNAEQQAMAIVLGDGLARNLNIKPGEELTLMGSTYDGGFAAAVVVVQGIFKSGVVDVDRSVAQIHLKDFDAIFAMEGRVHSIVINGPVLDDAKLYQQQLDSYIEQHQLRQASSNPKLALLNWQQLHPAIKQSIEADFVSSWFMYSVLIILVSFSVLNTQLMSVLERTREFGIMMAVGCRHGVLVRLIFSEVFLLAGLGFVLGVALGTLVVLYFSHHGLSFPGMEDAAALYNMPTTLYPQLSLLSLTMGPAVLFLACLLATLYPALRLYFLQPVVAMRAK